jgi:hypothetical protein
LEKIAFTTPVLRQEDIGIDFLCTLAEPKGTMLWAGPSFAVQAKNQPNTIRYLKDYELEWICKLQEPLLIAIGDEEEQRVSLYSTWRRMRVVLDGAPGGIIFSFASRDPEQPLTEKDATGCQTVYLGIPIVQATPKEMADPAHAKKIRRVVEQWIHIDRTNIVQAFADIHWNIGPHTYRTNEGPGPVFELSIFWNPKNLASCARNFGRSVTAFRKTFATFCECFAPAEPERFAAVTARKLGALDAAIRAWNEDPVFDPKARDLIGSCGVDLRVRDPDQILPSMIEALRDD